MGAGLYMPPMMFSAGMQQMHAAHAAHLQAMSVGMALGLGFGMGVPDPNGASTSFPVLQMPQMHGSHFPGLSVSGPTTLHGMAGSNYQPFGLPPQRHPISMPQPPIIPLSGGPGPFMKSSMDMNGFGGMVAPVNNMDSATGSSSRDLEQNTHSQTVNTSDTNDSMDQPSTEVSNLTLHLCIQSSLLYKKRKK